MEKLRQFNLRIFLKTNWPTFLLLTLLVLLVYSNILDNAFVSDDIPEILRNPWVGDFSFVISHYDGIVRPFLNWIAFNIGGLNPFFYHLINLSFHLGSVWLVFILITLMYRQRTAFFAAGLLAVHPIFSEAVTWISGGNYIQYSFFFLLSWVIYILSKVRPKLYPFSLLAFFFSLESHQSAVVLSLIILLYEISFGSLRQNLPKIIPFFILSGIFAIFPLLALPARVSTLQTVHYQDRQGIDNPILQVPIALSSYLWLFIWPKDLTLYHSELSFTLFQYLINLTIFVLLVIAAVYGYTRNRSVFFWLIFLVITLLLTLTPFRLTWVVAERYVYLGSLGLAVIVALGLTKLTSMERFKKITYILFFLLLITLGVRTISRNNDWQNEDTLWIATGKTSPSSPNNHNNLGDVYGRHGDKARAAQEFQKAIELKPNYADAYHNLANTYQEMGQIDKAIENYKKAAFYNPNLWQSYQNLGALYFAKGQWQDAVANFQKAIQINPRDLHLPTYLGVVYLKMGEKEKAENLFSFVLSQDPGNQLARQGLAELTR